MLRADAALSAAVTGSIEWGETISFPALTCAKTLLQEQEPPPSLHCLSQHHHPFTKGPPTSHTWQSDLDDGLCER